MVNPGALRLVLPAWVFKKKCLHRMQVSLNWQGTGCISFVAWQPLKLHLTFSLASYKCVVRAMTATTYNARLLSYGRKYKALQKCLC